MANKAARIRKLLELSWFEPDLMRNSLLERHPLTWLVEVNGIPVDARWLPQELQDEAPARVDPRPRPSRGCVTVEMRPLTAEYRVDVCAVSLEDLALAPTGVLESAGRLPELAGMRLAVAAAIEKHRHVVEVVSG